MKNNVAEQQYLQYTTAVPTLVDFVLDVVIYI